jgi:2-polyprenyl-3-methyl-5-hydroxy-6-metoxy-1,4-benzoquinol methylase
MQDWRRRLYDRYVSSGQGGKSASSGYRSEAPFINKIIAWHIPADRGIRIIDLGCGAGGKLYWLKRAGYSNISGVDFSPEMVNAALGAGISEVRLGDLQTELSATANDSVDVVLVLDVLEHLERRVLFEVCDEIFRILKPGGRIVAHVPNAEGIFGSRVRYGDLTHELAFTSSSIRQLLQTIGFREVKCYEDRPIPHGVKSCIRAFLWYVGTMGFRAIYAVETGSFDCILSQNLLATAIVPI